MSVSTVRTRHKAEPRLFMRQRRLLTLLDALGGRAGNIDFQKLLFLYCQEPCIEDLYDFVPYSFSYKFEDAAGRSSELQVLEWQIGALYRNCLDLCEGDEVKALVKVRQKYFDEFLKTDLHFFLGTTQQFHFVAPNPWVIVGVFPIPHERQLDLF